jgi:photosystem II stability/assembly factor-like uncharacterized protein
MKKTLLITLLVFGLSFLQAQNPENGFLHVQSYFNPSRYLLNDSILVMANTTGHATYQKFYTHINLNTLKWQHINEESGHLIFSPLQRAMKDSLNGVIISNGALYYTQDGGTSWTLSNITYTTNQTQSLLAVYNTKYGYLVHTSFSSNNYLYNSADGVSFQAIGWVNGFNNPAFVGDTIYYLNNNQRIHISPDGGETFPNQDFIFNLPNTTTWAHVVNHTLMFCGGSGVTYRSTDGGETWLELTLSPNFPTIGRVVFRDDQRGILIQNWFNNIFVTQDGGATWEERPRPNLSQSIYFAGERLVQSGVDDGIYYSDDLGLNWKLIFEPFPSDNINDVSFYKNLGIVVGDEGFFAVSHDGGYHFEIGEPFINQRLMAANVLNDSIIIARTFGGWVYRSTDSGQTWTPSGSATINSDSYLKHNGNGRIITYANAPIMSIDTAASFSTAPVSANVAYGDFVPSGHLIGARPETEGVRIRKYNVPGYDNIEELFTIPPGFEILDIEMASDNVGYVFGTEGDEKLVTYLTTNGGNNWTRQNGITTDVNFARQGLSIETLGESQIAIAQSHFNQNFAPFNKLFMSNNQGVEWTEYTIPDFGFGTPQFALMSAHFFNTEQFFLGFRGRNLYLNAFADQAQPIDDGGVVSVSENIVPFKQQLTLFPNPANEITYLSINENHLMAESEITIEVLDLAGRRLIIEKTVIDNTTPRINISPLQAGVYLVGVSVNGKYLTSKLVVQ